MHFMNKARGKHMGQSPEPRKAEEADDVNQSSGQHHAPSIHIESHANGHTVEIMHHDGRQEKFEHESGDAEGIAAHIHQHLGSGEKHGQDHGYSSDDEMENEHGYGPGV